ncbi:MAG: hypothetical protein PHV42_00165 [Candidatus Pacebacteria bacterium]|nr:hypothetical protein [Candidatus Paceibacterota bacterium]
MRRAFKHYFIPHEGNDYKPHFLREASVTSLLCLVLTLFIFSIIYGLLVVKTNVNAYLISAHLPWYQGFILSLPTFITDAYLVVAGAVVLSLVFLIFIEIRRQHPKNIFFGFFLLLLVLVFLYASRAILFPQLIAI